MRLECKLAERGINPPLDWFNPDIVAREDLPDWFKSNGNLLLAPKGLPLPQIRSLDEVCYPTNGLIVLGESAHLSLIMIWGHTPIVVLAGNARLPSGNIHCGDGALVYCGENISAAQLCEINVRNGGFVFVEGNGLWSNNVKILADDMHAIRDMHTGARINAFGGRVLVHDHVWLGLDVVLLSGSDVGQNCVVGARSVVTGQLPANSVSIGVPARPVRHEITWTWTDDP